ncbi:hypothetical protein STENM223S_00294 [Streptomyces tendae]
MAESVVLDPVDLHLLRLLQNDARTTYRDLAAQVGVAPSTCLDRVTRLRRSGVILGHRLQLDPAKLGRGLQALLSVQVIPHRRELVGPFVERIRALPESLTVFHLTGPDDYLVHVVVGRHGGSAAAGAGRVHRPSGGGAGGDAADLPAVGLRSEVMPPSPSAQSA